MADRSVHWHNRVDAASLEKLMKDFSIHHKTARTPAGWTPKTGDLVSAQFSEDDQWLVFAWLIDILVTNMYWASTGTEPRSKGPVTCVRKQKSASSTSTYHWRFSQLLKIWTKERFFWSTSGNEETTAFSRIRPLDSGFKGLPGQAQEARLSFVKLAGTDTDYGAEALDRFKQLSEVNHSTRDFRLTERWFFWNMKRVEN
jgi:staphylococcal nuclease domain-containing protein 1